MLVKSYKGEAHITADSGSGLRLTIVRGLRYCHTRLLPGYFPCTCNILGSMTSKLIMLTDVFLRPTQVTSTYIWTFQRNSSRDYTEGTENARAATGVTPVFQGRPCDRRVPPSANMRHD